jgi:hypothetical protein
MLSHIHKNKQLWKVKSAIINAHKSKNIYICIYIDIHFVHHFLHFRFITWTDFDVQFWN